MYVVSRGTEAKVIQRLEEIEKKEGELPDFVQLYRQLLQLQDKARAQFASVKPNLDESTISDRLSQGIPLVSFADLSLDWAQVQGLLQEIISLAAKDSPDMSQTTETLSNSLSDTALLEEAVRVWYEGSSLLPLAKQHAINGDLLALLVAATMKPFLTAYAEVLLPKVEQESWRRRYCPICRGQPDFAYLDKERGARWLLCSRCDAEWLFQRLECPHCGSQDQKALSYYTDDEGLYRLYVCDGCKRYLKTIDLRQTETEVLLPLERLFSFELDIEAQQQGYNPCAGVNMNEKDEEGV